MNFLIIIILKILNKLVDFEIHFYSFEYCDEIIKMLIKKRSGYNTTSLDSKHTNLNKLIIHKISFYLKAYQLYEKWSMEQPSASIKFHR